MAHQNVDAPHPKRRMRMAAREELCGRFECVEDLFMDRPVQVNVKPDEWAKPGKDPRAVNDFGCAASIRAGWLPEALKCAMEKVQWRVGGGCCVYVKSPDVAVLSRVFSRMYRSSLFVYHSDDSSLSLVCDDGMFWCNLDISSCDTSQGPSVFEFLYLLCPEEHLRVMSLLLAQCSQPCKVGHGRKRLMFRPNRYFEYSGSLLTTLLNNVASFTIGRLILQGWKGGSRVDARRHVQSVLLECGWKVTLEEESSFGGLQFLKHSPCLSEEGEVRAVTNLGVLLRALGQKSGSLPKGDPVERSTSVLPGLAAGLTQCFRSHSSLVYDVAEQARRFNAGLVAGFVHCGNTSFLRLLQEKFPLKADTAVRHGSNITRFLTGGSTILISDVSLLERYQLTTGAYQEMLDLFAVADIGDLIDCEATRTIIHRDYGL